MVEPRAPALSLRDDELSIVRDARALTERRQHFLERGCHVLALSSRTSALAPSHGVAFAEILIDADDRSCQVYHDAAVMTPGHVALTKQGLDLIAACAGIVWLPTSRRVDGRSIQNLWEYHVDGAITGYDGTPQILPGTAEVDLRDGSAQIGEWTPSKWRGLAMRNSRMRKRDPKASLQLTINGWDDKKVLLYRKHGLRVSETKAKNAAIRTLGLKATYTVDELQQPFVVFRVIYLPDMTDHAVKQMVTANALRGASILYMPTAPPAATTQEADAAPTDPLLRPDFPL